MITQNIKAWNWEFFSAWIKKKKQKNITKFHVYIKAIEIEFIKLLVKKK